MSSPLQYRAASFLPVPAWRRWWPLAWQEATVLFRSRWGLGVFFVCLLPGIVRLVMLLIMFGVLQFGPPQLRGFVANRPRGDLGTIDPMRVEFYVDPVLQPMPGMVFVLLLSSLVVARAIARDRPTNALELYWTRGISPWAYLLAKWVGSLLVVGILTVVVPLVLYLTAVLLAEDWSLLADTWLAMAQALVGLALVTAIWTGMGIFLSASCGTPNAAMVLWSMLLVGSSAVGVVAASATREGWLRSTLSVWEAGAVVARAVGGITQRHVSVAGSLATLGVLLLLLWLRARRHLRVTEALE